MKVGLDGKPIRKNTPLWKTLPVETADRIEALGREGMDAADIAPVVGLRKQVVAAVLRNRRGKKTKPTRCKAGHRVTRLPCLQCLATEAAAAAKAKAAAQ